jgi:hypothetical protein
MARSFTRLGIMAFAGMSIGVGLAAPDVDGAVVRPARSSHAKAGGGG